MAPLREIDPSKLLEVDKKDIRDVTIEDFRTAFEKFIPSYRGSDALKEFEDWGEQNKE
jgi:hypothetical protein